MAYYLGCDLGGTNIKAGIVNLESGSVIIAKSKPTLSFEGYDAVMDRMVDLITSLITDPLSRLTIPALILVPPKSHPR